MFALLFALAGPAHAFNLVASTEDLGAIAAAIGGDDVTVSHIARGDNDPHFVDAKPSYMLKLANADLVVAAGMELEVGWLPGLLTGSRNPRVQPGTPGYLDASAGITAIEVPVGNIDRSRGDLHPQGNPHYWLDPENGRVVARAIAARLDTLDAAHKDHYDANLAAFEAKLTTKEAEWAEKMAPLKGAPVVGYHMTFNYLFRVYGLQVVGFVEPKPGIPPTPAHTLELQQVATATKARFIVVETYHDPRDGNPIAAASGAKVVVLPTSVGGTDTATDYFSLFDTIVAALTGA